MSVDQAIDNFFDDRPARCNEIKRKVHLRREAFQKERQKLNNLVMKYAGLGTKRFYSLDSQAYRAGAWR